MGFPTKVQLIKRQASEQWYINFPSALAQAMEFSRGETVEWFVEDKGLLALRRTTVPPALLLLATQRAFAESRHALLPRPKWIPSSPSSPISTQQAINQLRAEVWGRGLGLDNFSPFASSLPTTTKPQKLSFPLAAAVCYATA
jgi:hypothetical protein